jgi:DNA-binding PucR family transcriptional regulator
VNWLCERYLVPLESARDSGAGWRRTLRAYFSTGCNGASAAVILKIKRQGVSYRLRTAQARLGCTLADRGAEIDLALRLEELGEGSP